MLQIAFGAESQLTFRRDAGVTTIAGDRISARIKDLQDKEVALIQADRSELLEGKGDVAIVLLSGNPVVFGGDYVIDADEVQFNPSTGYLVMVSPIVRSIDKAALTYRCEGLRLYRNDTRVVGDEDIVPYTGSIVMVTRCRNGKAETTLMFVTQVP